MIAMKWTPFSGLYFEVICAVSFYESETQVPTVVAGIYYKIEAFKDTDEEKLSVSPFAPK